MSSISGGSGEEDDNAEDVSTHASEASGFEDDDDVMSADEFQEDDDDWESPESEDSAMADPDYQPSSSESDDSD